MLAKVMFSPVRRAFLPILSLALLLLLAGTWLTWQHRFEIDPACPHLTLEDLVRGVALDSGVTIHRTSVGNTELVLQTGSPSRPVVQLLPLPLSGEVGFLMFGMAVKAEGIVPGPTPWSDGRLMIEWHSGDRPLEAQYLTSSRADDASETICMVTRPAHGPAMPVLRLEHLGRSGTFRLEHCRIDVVRETAWWRTGHWVLLGAWFAWATALAAWGRTSGLGGALLAAALWVLCATQWAVPGPWQSIRPLAPLFATGEVKGRAVLSPPILATSPSPAVARNTQSPQSLGELPFGGSVLLEIKDHIKQARPLFHTLLFLGPTLAFVFLIGRWRSVLFSTLLAGAIEWSQYLFGFGFDGSDLFDLSFDALGIMLALWVHARAIKWLRKRKEATARGEALAESGISSGQAT